MIDRLLGVVIGDFAGAMILVPLVFAAVWLFGKAIGVPLDDRPLTAEQRKRLCIGSRLVLGAFFFVVYALPLLLVLWGYATGRLPVR